MTGDAACIGEPISWLRLEAYALGDAADASEIARHLAACDACRGCLRRIETDARAELPALPRRIPPRRAPTWRRAALATGSAVALAAAAILVLGRGQRLPEVDDRVKGSDVGFELVRDDDTLLAEAGGTFRDGDRFKAVVSCAPGARTRFDLVVWDDAGASFPLEVPADFACGNDVPLPGAFRLHGTTPMRVCLLWGDAPPDRAELARSGYTPRSPRSACKELQAAP